jgi:HEPN domain-containing protein
MDLDKQIEYWRQGSEEELEVAGELLKLRKWRQGMFFAHLALEKILKAHVTKTTRAIPPKSHKLVRLAELAALTLSEQQRDFLREFQIYNIEGRYPDLPAPPLDPETVQRQLAVATEMIEWLINQL